MVSETLLDVSISFKISKKCFERTHLLLVFCQVLSKDGNLRHIRWRYCGLQQLQHVCISVSHFKPEAVTESCWHMRNMIVVKVHNFSMGGSLEKQHVSLYIILKDRQTKTNMSELQRCFSTRNDPCTSVMQESKNCFGTMVWNCSRHARNPPQMRWRLVLASTVESMKS